MNDTAANDNQANPEVLARRASMAAQVAPTEDYLRLRAKLDRRQRQGGTGPVPANDNQSWPLAEQLRREGNEVLLFVAERYRRTYDAAHTEAPLIGTIPDEVWSPEQHHAINSKTGKLKLNGQKRSKTAAGMPSDDGTYKIVPIDDEVREEIESGVSTFKIKPAKAITKKWAGDGILIAAIDAKKTIWRLQSALGPLADVFEDAVLHGETLSTIGERKGVTPQKSGAAGRVLVMMGLEVVQREFHQIDREAA